MHSFLIYVYNIFMALNKKILSYIHRRKEQLERNHVLGIHVKHSDGFAHSIKMRGYPFSSSVSSKSKDDATLDILKNW